MGCDSEGGLQGMRTKTREETKVVVETGASSAPRGQGGCGGCPSHIWVGPWCPGLIGHFVREDWAMRFGKVCCSPAR
ncbi:hypothetical protein SLA2020_401560 [Shorea laevis]